MIQVLINTMSSASLIALIALSFWFVYAPTRTFYFSHAAAIPLGAYGTYYLQSRLNFCTVFATGFSVLAIAAFFVCVDFLLLRHFRSNSKGWTGLVASIGLYAVLQNLISLAFGDETLLLHAGRVQLGQKVGNGFMAPSQEVIVVVSVLAFCFCGLLLFGTKLGRGIRAVASNQSLALIFGISPTRVVSYAIAIGCALAALGGVLYAYDMDLKPRMGFPLLMRGVVALIVAGVGSISGLIYAAFLLALAQNLTAYFFGVQWMDTVTYSVLIVFLMWRPLGFKGDAIRRIEA